MKNKHESNQAIELIPTYRKYKGQQNKVNDNKRTNQNNKRQIRIWDLNNWPDFLNKTKTVGGGGLLKGL